MSPRHQLTRAASLCLGVVFGACANSPCQPGATQICVGVTGCRGGQICTADGSQWGTCDCGSIANPDAGKSSDSTPDATVSAATGTIRISAANPVPVAPTAFGINYWSWVPINNPNLDSTQSAVAALHPRIMRIGGGNNDGNTNPFDASQLEHAVNYARAIGAEILWQVPLLADNDGNLPTPDTAAAMVTLANVTNHYGIKYFSIGNEPDLYPDQIASLASFTPADYCAKVQSFVVAMKAVDSSVKIIGPDLSWKYRSGAQDWLTPILQQCGRYFDVVAVHRYPYSAAQATLADARIDANSLDADITSLRSKLAETGYGDVPLAITEMNITWDGSLNSSTLDASPGTLPAALWMADALGAGRTRGLWTTAPWSIQEESTLGFLTLTGQRRPAYFTYKLCAEHSGTSAIAVTSSPQWIHAYASRSSANNQTQLIIVNYNDQTYALDIEQSDLSAPVPTVTLTVPAVSVTAVDLPDSGDLHEWTYGKRESAAQSEPTAVR